MICNAVMHQENFMDRLVTVSFLKIKMERETPLPDLPRIKIL